uniref:Uncharacterized protein n=1 Tax=Biomphalaria glabrata TaxID=6526 RepID=A0A2C9KUR3_BIOGL
MFKQRRNKMIAVSPMSLIAALFGMSLVGLIEPKLHVEFGISPLDGDAETSSDVSITCAISDDTVNSGSMSNYDIQRCLIYKIDGSGWTALAAISKAESTRLFYSVIPRLLKQQGALLKVSMDPLSV